MADPLWPSLTPEANYLRLVGPGAAGTGTTTASGAAWQALMVSDEVAWSISAMNTAVTALNFEGVGGQSSTAALMGLNTALQVLAGWVQQKPPIAASAVAAYETAVSSMIPAQISIANRTEQAADVAINPAVLGALTPAIVALDTEYFGQHWPHNASVGATYGASLTALVAALALPPPLAPLGASPAAASATAAVAQTAASTAAGTAMKQAGRVGQAAVAGSAGPVPAAGEVAQMSSMLQPMQAVMGAATPLVGMFSAPTQALQGLSGMPLSMMGSLGGLGQVMKATDVAVPGVDRVGKTLLSETMSSPAMSAGGGIGHDGGVRGAGLTSYTRPTGSFTAEYSSSATPGRPTGLQPGLLSNTEFRGPTVSAGAPPLFPAHAGMLSSPRGMGNDTETNKGEVAQANIVILHDVNRRAP